MSISKKTQLSSLIHCTVIHLRSNCAALFYDFLLLKTLKACCGPPPIHCTVLQASITLLKGDTPWHLPLQQGSLDSSLSFIHGHLHHVKATFRDKLLLVGSYVRGTPRASTLLSTPGRTGALSLLLNIP